MHPSLKVNSVKELVALAKTKPGEINYASVGNGSVPHLAMELFSEMAGIKLLHIPYKGGAEATIKPLGLIYEGGCHFTQLLEFRDLARAFPDTTMVLNHSGTSTRGVNPMR